MLSMTIIDSQGNISDSFESREINRIEIKVAVPQAFHHVDYHITIFFDPSICSFKLCIYVENNVMDLLESLLNASVSDQSSLAVFKVAGGMSAMRSNSGFAIRAKPKSDALAIRAKRVHVPR